MIEEVRLDDLITLQRGFDISEKEQLEGNVPVISSGGFSSYHNEYKVTGPGVVIGRKGTLGKVFYTTENYWPHSTSLWVKDFKGNDPKFIYYLLQVLHFEKFDSGAANPTLNRNHIHSLKIKVPKKKYRSPIASILSAYDELIENNKQRIKLLEEMAEEIYKEWFVRLRFPNYENTEFVDGLPKGWEMKEFRYFGEIITGKTPSTAIDDYFNGNIPFVKTPDLSGFPYVISTNESLSELGAKTQNNKFIPKNSLMISCIGSAGIYALSSSDCQTNQQINSIRFYENFYSFYFYSLAKDLKTVLENLGSNGATMTNVNKGKFEKMKALFPTKELLVNYHELVKSNFELILTLQQKNQLLQQTRDLLLPRLISGKLSVEGLAEAKEYVLGQNGEHWPMAAEAEGDYHHS